MTTHTANPVVHPPLKRTRPIARARLNLVVAAAVCAGLTVAGAPVAVAKPKALTVLEVVKSFAGTGGFNASGNQPPAVGQGVVLKGTLHKLLGHTRGARAGAARVECTFTNAIGTSVCTAVISLQAGKLVASGLTPANPTKSYTLPVLGGSRLYANAKGHIRVTPSNHPNEATLSILLTS